MLGNYTSATRFYLVGFPGSENLCHIIFATFCFFYLVSLVGNTVIIVIVCVDKRLQFPMYFFLVHLSILEILLQPLLFPFCFGGCCSPVCRQYLWLDVVHNSFCNLPWGPQSFPCSELWLWTVT
ncbi:Olfactory receptor 9A2 [Lemmus lemmus]